MEVKNKPKAIESKIIATIEEDEIKKMKDLVVIGQETKEDISTKEQETMKIMEGLTKNLVETRQEDSMNDSSSSLDMIQKLENNKIFREKTKKEEEKKKENDNMKNKKTSSHVWDCGSSLYDSFELNSFKRQLDSAISASSARTMSMSHLPDRRIPSLDLLSPDYPPPPPPLAMSSSSRSKRNTNKISRSLQRFLKSVFRLKHAQSVSSSSTPSSPVYKAGHVGDKDRYYVVYDKSGSLTTIPESTEKEVGPEINSLVRKTVSERFPASRVVGISCA